MNTAWAWPTAGDKDKDTSIIVTQKFGDQVSVTVGKFNMLDQAYKTPIRGGGGYDEFMNIAPTAPVTGIIPPYLLGGNLTIKTEPVAKPSRPKPSELVVQASADNRDPGVETLVKDRIGRKGLRPRRYPSSVGGV